MRSETKVSTTADDCAKAKDTAAASHESKLAEQTRLADDRLALLSQIDACTNATSFAKLDLPADPAAAASASVTCVCRDGLFKDNTTAHVCLPHTVCTTTNQVNLPDTNATSSSDQQCGSVPAPPFCATHTALRGTFFV